MRALEFDEVLGRNKLKTYVAATGCSFGDSRASSHPVGDQDSN